MISRNTAINCLHILSGAYFNTFSKMDKLQKQNMVVLWQNTVSDDEYAVSAVYRYVTNDVTGYMPSVGQINSIITELKGTAPKTEHNRKVLPDYMLTDDQGRDDSNAVPELTEEQKKLLKEWQQLTMFNSSVGREIIYMNDIPIGIEGDFDEVR